MYNRYVPQSDGTYRRNRMESNTPPPPPKPEPYIEDTPPPSPKPVSTDAGSFLKNLLPKNLDTGDLLIIILLLLISGDSKENSANALLTLALYLFL